MVFLYHHRCCLARLPPASATIIGMIIPSLPPTRSSCLGCFFGLLSETQPPAHDKRRMERRNDGISARAATAAHRRFRLFFLSSAFTSAAFACVRERTGGTSHLSRSRLLCKTHGGAQQQQQQRSRRIAPPALRLGRAPRAFLGLGCWSPPDAPAPSPAAITFVVFAIARFSFLAWISVSIFARLKYSSYSCAHRGQIVRDLKQAEKACFALLLCFSRRDAGGSTALQAQSQAGRAQQTGAQGTRHGLIFSRGAAKLGMVRAAPRGASWPPPR